MWAISHLPPEIYAANILWTPSESLCSQCHYSMDQLLAHAHSTVAIPNIADSHICVVKKMKDKENFAPKGCRMLAKAQSV